MSTLAEESWRKAQASLAAAKSIVSIDPNSSASRAYYAAFHAVTALFAYREVTFSKHSQLRSAVHRDLVHQGSWDASLARDFDFLMDLRETGDYEGTSHVSVEGALEAVERAAQILDAVRRTEKRLHGS